MAQPGVQVRGLRELSKAAQAAGKATRAEFRADLLGVAEPVRLTAEQLAGQAIRNLGVGSPWSQMKKGATQRVVYVAPRRRNRFGPHYRRPNFGKLLLDRALLPALEQNQARIREATDRALDRVARIFEETQ